MVLSPRRVAEDGVWCRVDRDKSIGYAGNCVGCDRQQSRACTIYFFGLARGPARLALYMTRHACGCRRISDRLDIRPAWAAVATHSGCRVAWRGDWAWTTSRPRSRILLARPRSFAAGCDAALARIDVTLRERPSLHQLQQLIGISVAIDVPPL